MANVSPMSPARSPVRARLPGWAVSVPARCFGLYAAPCFAACCFAASSASCRAISSESFCSAAMRSDFACS